MQFFADAGHEELLFTEECLDDVILRYIEAISIAS